MNDLGTFTDSETMQRIRKIIRLKIDPILMLTVIVALIEPQHAIKTLIPE